MSGRPEQLFPLFAGLETLEGVGPKTAQTLQQAGIESPRDVLFGLPYAVVDRRRRDTIQGADLPTTLTVEVTVGTHRPPRNKGGAYRIHVEDSQADFQLVFFHARGDYLKKVLPQGSRRVVSGKLELFDGLAQMVHPDHMLPVEQAKDIPEFEPVYHLTQSLTQKTAFKAARSALARAPELVEWIDPAQVSQKQWPDWAEAIRAAHNPQGADDVAPFAPARERLAYDELLAHQLTLALARQRERKARGIVSIGTGKLQSKVLASLPYRPTGAQTRAIEEISSDMASESRMNRLLQGDVGAGKTLVAVMALLVAVEAGGQGVMMAPTEILARQHLEGLRPLAEEAGVVLEILTGRDKGAERRAKLDALKTRRYPDSGGHPCRFPKRRGVPRASLGHRRRTAPVWRTPTNGAFGKGAGRGCSGDDRHADPPKSGVGAIWRHGCLGAGRKAAWVGSRSKRPLSVRERMDEVVAHLRRAIADGRQCLLGLPSGGRIRGLGPDGSGRAVQTVARDSWAKDVVGLVHGQMPPADKDAAMAAFQDRKNQGSGGYNRDRGWRERSQCLDHGDRTGRDFRPCATAPVARTRWPWGCGFDVFADVSTAARRGWAQTAGSSAGNRGRVPHFGN